MNKLVSLITGIIFGVGLVISEMINPEKVLGFLDLFGNWDPSLAFVMIGALVVSSPLFHLIKKKEKPIFAENFNYSNNKSINNKLILGSHQKNLFPKSVRCLLSVIHSAVYKTRWQTVEKNNPPGQKEFFGLLEEEQHLWVRHKRSA